jgi:hypothetical protein
LSGILDGLEKHLDKPVPDGLFLVLALGNVSLVLGVIMYYLENCVLKTQY